MPFPTSLSGAVAARNVTSEQALDRLERALARASALSVQRRGGSIEFRGCPWFMSSSWNVLLPITRGVLDVSTSADAIHLRYRVTFTHMLAFVTVATAVLSVGLTRAPQVSVLGGLGFLTVGWLWLTGVNFLSTRCSVSWGSAMSLSATATGLMP